MPEHFQYEEDDLFNPETHHESTDVPVRPLLWFIVIFIAFAVVSHLAILFFYRGLANVERKKMDPPATALKRPVSADVPQNQPLLQPFPTVDPKGQAIPPQSNTPVTDMVHMREQENARLNNYGWVDRQRGIVHMPIQTAKQILAARLAVQGQLGNAPATPATGTAAAAPAAPLSTPSPAGTAVPPDTGAVAPATTNTTGGTHQ